MAKWTKRAEERQRQDDQAMYALMSSPVRRVDRLAGSGANRLPSEPPEEQAAPRVWIEDGKTIARFPGGEPFEVKEPAPRGLPPGGAALNAAAALDAFGSEKVNETLLALPESRTLCEEKPRLAVARLWEYLSDVVGWFGRVPTLPEELILEDLPEAGGVRSETEALRRLLVLVRRVSRPPKPRPAPTLPQLELVADAAEHGWDGDLTADEEEALVAFRAYILHGDPEAGQNLAEIHPALVRIGELALWTERASLDLLAFERDPTIGCPMTGAQIERGKVLESAVRRTARKLAGSVAEYRRRFPDPAVLPDLPEE